MYPTAASWLRAVVVAAGLACGGAACEVEGDGDELEHVTVDPAATIYLVPGSGYVPVDRASLGVARPATPPGLDDPCTCDTQDCLAGWADEHLGCNVCVTYICDGTPGPHVCNRCAVRVAH